MTRYLRMGYLVPRLVLLVALLCATEFGSGWALHHYFVKCGQQAIGARVELGKASVSLLDARVTLHDLQVANPNQPMENLLEAERLELDFETDSLLRRKAIAQRGSVRGLRFGTPRSTSGVLDPSEQSEGSFGAPAWLSSAVTDRAQAATDQWVDQLQQKLLVDSADELESVRLAEELAEHWPARYESLRQSAVLLNQDTNELRKQAREAMSNPLRNAEQLSTFPGRIAALEQRLAQLHAELRAVPQEIKVDRERIAAARINDEQLIRQRFATDQLDPESLTSYLLGEQVTSPVRELLGWVRWGRQMIPAGAKRTAATPRDRGADINFLGVRQRPDLLVRALDIDGFAQLAGHPVQLTGIVTDFTTTPKLHGAPMRVVLQTSGALPMEIRATVDRTKSQPVDELIADCNGLELPQYDLGKEDRFRFSIAPSTANLSLNVRVEGEQLTGNLLLIQDSLHLKTSFASEGQLANKLQTEIDKSLSNISKTTTSVALGGTLDRPRIGMQSTIGSTVADAVRVAVRRVGQAESERLLAESRQRIDSKLSVLDNLMTKANSDLTAQLAGPQQEIERLASDLLGNQLGSFSFERLGKQLPKSGSIFK